MNNPLSVLGIILGATITIPIVLSIFTYDSIERDERLDINVENKITYERVDKESPQIELYHTNLKKTENIDIETYLVGVVASEMPSDFNQEALKAQAVAARTYAMYLQEVGNKSGHKGADICTDHTHCQAYKGKSELESIKGQEWMKTEYPKIEEAVKSTKGQIITYESEPILPLYFSTSSGKTENSKEVFSTQEPYLISVESTYDEISPKYSSNLLISIDDFISALKSKYSNFSIDKSNISKEIEVIENSEGGSIKEIKIGNIQCSGRDIRSLFNLNSSNFEIVTDKENVVFEVKGYGHGVGMSQWGANVMGKEGHMYYDIIKHYYTDVDITDIY